MTEKTRVHFRRERDGECLAVFPFDKAGAASYACYAHMGQHSAASYAYIMGQTTRATPAEYASLKQELEGETYGYLLEVLPTWPRGA